MSPKRARALLDRIGCVSHACDLDLLLFLHRHPRAVLTSERLALYIGYGLAEVAESLERLIEAGLLARVQRPTGSARMYLLATTGDLGGWLDTLLKLASTRNGRLAVLAALRARQASTEPPRSLDPELRDMRVIRVRPLPQRVREVRHA
jgi:hypothetical protein